MIDSVSRRDERRHQEEIISTSGDQKQSILKSLLVHGCGPGYPSKKMKKDHHNINEPDSQQFGEVHINELQKEISNLMTSEQQKYNQKSRSQFHPDHDYKYEQKYNSYDIKREPQSLLLLHLQSNFNSVNTVKQERPNKFENLLRERLTEPIQKRKHEYQFTEYKPKLEMSRENLQLHTSQTYHQPSDNYYSIPYPSYPLDLKSEDYYGQFTSDYQDDLKPTDAPILRCILKHLDSSNKKRISKSYIKHEEEQCKFQFGNP